MTSSAAAATAADIEVVPTGEPLMRLGAEALHQLINLYDCSHMVTPPF